ncbi:hypothetical protein B0H11DRAFT_2417371 [Mycena galericulata]|nr:hypothetical protein B0H11DRAFT_2417371 [Mycena galericulata]
MCSTRRTAMEEEEHFRHRRSTYHKEEEDAVGRGALRAHRLRMGIQGKGASYSTGAGDEMGAVGHGIHPKLQYLTHTSSNSILVRKFSIGLAFIFSSHVLAFPSIDLVFQPTWATSLSGFSIPANIFTSTSDYLVLLADWIEGILLFSHSCL